MQTLRVKLAFRGEPQDTSRKLVRPDFVVAVELEGQPGFVKGRFQHHERLRTKRSVAKSAAKSSAKSSARSSAKSTHVPSPEREKLQSIVFSLLQDMARIVECAALQCSHVA